MYLALITPLMLFAVQIAAEHKTNPFQQHFNLNRAKIMRGVPRKRGFTWFNQDLDALTTISIDNASHEDSW